MKELGLESSVDTLGRWMAHHLAELLDRANKAPDEEKDDARQNCANLIIQLWVHRASLNVNHRPLESFNPIMEAIERLRGDTPAYFRDIRKEGEWKASKSVNGWLDHAIQVDSIARELVRTCVNFAIDTANKDEEEWLRASLNLSLDSDMDLKVIINLIEQNSKDQKESPEELAVKRFKEYGEICIKIANQLQTSIGES